eukprot:c18203_g1_i1.p2 GENE.c18203_g1_i1~~c18203_g1_i1.p2  ORF type:complete len:213 (-),score=55.67 c18203_g1_i1:1924-2562(-)
MKAEGEAEMEQLQSMLSALREQLRQSKAEQNEELSRREEEERARKMTEAMLQQLKYDAQTTKSKQRKKHVQQFARTCGKCVEQNSIAFRQGQIFCAWDFDCDCREAMAQQAAAAKGKEEEGEEEPELVRHETGATSTLATKPWQTLNTMSEEVSRAKAAARAAQQEVERLKRERDELGEQVTRMSVRQGTTRKKFIHIANRPLTAAPRATSL